MQAEKYDRTEKPVVCRDTSHEHRHHHRFVESTHSASYSEWDDDKAWKSDELMDDRTEKPVVCPQRGAHAFQSRFSREHKHFILEEEENHDRTGKPVVCPQRGTQQFVIEDDETESELSLGSRSLAETIFNEWDRRQRQTFCAMGNVYVFNIAIICIHGKNYSDNWHSIKNTKDLTMKQMFDISGKLVSEQDEIYGVKNN